LSRTILIVDDSALIRRSVRSCIEQNSDWKVCGEAENGEVAIEKVKQLNPDVVILDLQMPVMNGLEAAKHIASIAPSVSMVMLTLHNCEQLFKEAQAVGIRDVVPKSGRVADHLLASLKRICAGP
jgi:DNA-binding NarL/FixJ family response regulator